MQTFVEKPSSHQAGGKKAQITFVKESRDLAA
jgi:hypothetical protein